MEAVAAEVGWVNRERRRARGHVMALLARDLKLALGTENEEFEHARILEYYRYSAYGTATVLPAHDDGTEYGWVDTGVYSGSGQDDGSGSHHAWDGVEDTPLTLDDNNALMLARRNGTTHSGSNIPTSRDYSIPGARGESYGRVSQFGNFTTFTGRMLDTTTGLMHYRYRYYESVAGRFVGRDPARDPWSNLLASFKSVPNRASDPMGLYKIEHSDCPSSYLPCWEKLAGCLKTGIDALMLHLDSIIDGKTKVGDASLNEVGSAAHFRGEVARAKWIKDKLKSILSSYLDAGDLSFECVCCKGSKKETVAFAWVVPTGLLNQLFGDDEINVCPMFFGYKCDDMVGIMFHEITHIVLRTEDHAYHSSIYNDIAAYGGQGAWDGRVEEEDKGDNADSWRMLLKRFQSGCQCDPECDPPRGDFALMHQNSPIRGPFAPAYQRSANGTRALVPFKNPDAETCLTVPDWRRTG